jgi:hypothetical protein
MARDVQPEFIESGLGCELSTRRTRPVKCVSGGGQVIAAGQDARLVPARRWIHGACPVEW